MPSGIYIHKKGYHLSEKCKGKNHYRWKGGLSRTNEYQKKYQRLRYEKNKEYIRNKEKEYRHKKGISKNYREKYNNRSKTKEYKRLSRKQYKARIKGGGELSIKTIQLVYEDNIKRYGTLTCYLCEKPIEIGKDHLEHKIPLSRGGTNEYNNLAVACQRCNLKKFNKTEEEFRNGGKYL